MSSTSSQSLIESNEGIKRVFSGNTDESPFGSELVTPEDEELYPNQRIHARLETAKSALGYFADKKKREIKEIQPAPPLVSPQSEGELSLGFSTDNSVEFREMTKNFPIPLSDSAQSFSSAIPSISSADSIRRRRAGSIYTLPNDHIVVEPKSKDSDTEGELVKPDSDDQPSNEISMANVDSLSNLWTHEVKPLISSLSIRSVFASTLRIVLFLPWCTAVGGALVFFPEYLEFVAFGLGYVDSVSGIRRFSHWAEYGFQHIVAFFTFLGLSTWLFPQLGWLVIGGLLAQFCIVWHNFLSDSTIALGDDDRQTVYLLATTTWMNDSSLKIRQVGESYYWTASLMAEEMDYDSD